MNKVTQEIILNLLMCYFDYVQFDGNCLVKFHMHGFTWITLLLQERPLSKSLQKGEDPQFDQVGSIETCISNKGWYAKLSKNYYSKVSGEWPSLPGGVKLTQQFIRLSYWCEGEKRSESDCPTPATQLFNIVIICVSFISHVVTIISFPLYFSC